MSVERTISGFRICFLFTICVVSYLALTPLDYPSAIRAFWDKGNHLAAFITLAFLLDYAVSGYWRKWLGLAGYGFTIEIAQWFSGYRFFELSDIFADCLGIAIYVTLRTLSLKIQWLANIRKLLDKPAFVEQELNKPN